MTYLPQILLALAAAASSPAAAPAQPTPARPGSEPTGDGLTAQDREVLAAAEQLATDAGQLMEQWIATQGVSEDQLFARLYFPLLKAAPQRWTTRYDGLADRDLAPIEDKVLARYSALSYAFVTDLNAYVPAHNTRFAQPPTGNPEQDHINIRTKQLLGDVPSLLAARSEAHYLIQRVRLSTGELIYDVSVPVVVRGKHWGCARVGFRRTE